MRERRLLYVTAFLRALGTGTVGVLLGVYLARVGLTASAIGTVVSAGLTGAAASAVVATFFGDRIGRHRLLISFTLLSLLGTVGMVLSDHPVLVTGFAFLGMVNGMGRDRGGALILEQAALPRLTSNKERTEVIAWYTMLQDIGHALGALAATLPSIAAARLATAHTGVHRGTIAGAAALGIVAIIVYRQMGPLLDEPVAARHQVKVSEKSRAILVRISALFAIDGLGGGFLSTALISYFFFNRFGAGESAIGLLFFSARILNALSHLGAAWLAKRIGLVNTMVFTHIPSSLFLVTVAFAPTFEVAALLFLLREGLVEMDVPTRQSYVLAVVAPEERTFASGITNLVRLFAWAIAPLFAGLAMEGEGLHVPLLIGAALKISYDVILWRSFRAIRPPEEQG